MEIDRFEWQISDDPDAPTVDDILKGKGRSVMDAEAARVSTAELEDTISDLLLQRKQLARFIEREGADPKGAESMDSSVSKSIADLFSRTVNFLNSISRDPIEYNMGLGKDEMGNYVGPISISSEEAAEQARNSKFAHDSLAQKPVGDEALRAALVQSQLNSRWPLNLRIEVEINIRITENERNKMVLLPDPDWPTLPHNSQGRLIAFTITPDDPEYYKIRTPKVNAVYDEAGNLLAEYPRVSCWL
jgi:hypothetical protein